MRAALWLCLVAPSIFIVERRFGWAGVAVHAVVAAAALPLILRAATRLSPDAARRAALATGVVLLLVTFIGHRYVDVDLPDRGSDDDDAHEVGAWAIVKGENPYAARTYLGNTISPMPGALLLALPFVVAGIFPAASLFWLWMFVRQLARDTGDPRRAIGWLSVAVLLCAPVVHNLVTATSHLGNTLYVLLGLLWVIRSRGSALSSAAWGLTLASRANFFFLVPCVVGWLYRMVSPTAAVRAAACTSASLALLILPFYLPDPAGFAPLNTLEKVSRYEDVLPAASVIVPLLTALVAAAVGMRARSVPGLLAGCGAVQAFPIVLVTLLSFAAGRPYLAALSYGEFAMWFVLAGAALSARDGAAGAAA